MKPQIKLALNQHVTNPKNLQNIILSY